MVDTAAARTEAMRARGEPVAALGPAPGFRELKWLKPVYVGDTIDLCQRGDREARLPTAGRDWG